MKSGLSKSRRGYTLIELSVAIGCGLIAAALLLALVNQQFAFLRIYAAQNFLIQEAPLISSHMNRLIGQADRFRLHNSTDDALAGTNPLMDGASVLVLNFQQPDGTTQAAMLAFQNLGDGDALYYYLVPAAGALPAPQWAITRKADNVSFSIVNGILRVTLTGPNQEQITYSGVMQQ
jgi:type II secretory pathway pseudopilin PulG